MIVAAIVGLKKRFHIITLDTKELVRRHLVSVRYSFYVRVFFFISGLVQYIQGKVDLHINA